MKIYEIDGKEIIFVKQEKTYKVAYEYCWIEREKTMKQFLIVEEETEIIITAFD